jgi:hypothetical protein
VAATLHDEGLERAIGTTALTVFPQVWRWRVLRFNVMLFAFSTPQSRPELLERAERVPGRIRLLVPFFERIRLVRPEGPPLTDDRAPVEWLTDRMIFEQIARGEGLDEERLPTKP